MRAKKVNETGGAGYSSAGKYAGLGGGRGMGYGGSSSVGGPNLMYTYSIIPLTHVLEPKATTSDDTTVVHVGDEISGRKINQQNKAKKYTGNLIAIKKSSSTNKILYYLIIDEVTKTKIKIDPATVQILNPKATADTKELTGDLLQRQYIKNENVSIIKAKKVNE